MKPFLRLGYYDTYWFTSVIHNVLQDPLIFGRHMDSFFGDGAVTSLIKPFQKKSLLHRFAYFAIESVDLESIDDVMVDSVVAQINYDFWSTVGMRYYQIEHEGFATWLRKSGIRHDDIEEDTLLHYREDLLKEGSLTKLYEQIADEIFFVMFLNREFMKGINEWAAQYVHDVNFSALSANEASLFRKQGVLKRHNIPAWVKRAVFYRDRGACSLCHKPISGLVSITSYSHYDHIVALNQSGLNDITNIQLLCEPCNTRKKDGLAVTSSHYERWYT